MCGLGTGVIGYWQFYTKDLEAESVLFFFGRAYSPERAEICGIGRGGRMSARRFSVPSSVVIVMRECMSLSAVSVVTKGEGSGQV